MTKTSRKTKDSPKADPGVFAPTPQVETVAVAAEATEASAQKSIINPKYRDKYKKQGKDWLGQMIEKVTRTVEKIEKKVKAEDGTESTSTIEKPGDTHLPALFNLARINGLYTGKNVDKLGQLEKTANAGRAVMTIRNMLQPVVKQRHGLYLPSAEGDQWTAAPNDWLGEKNAPETPTHNRDGSPIAKPKAKKDEAEGSESAAAA